MRKLASHIAPMLLALALIAGLLTGCRDKAFTHQGVRYELADSGLRVIALTQGQHYAGHVSIPDSVPCDDGRILAVVALADGAFEGCDSLHSLVIPATVAHLGESTFKGCTGLHDLHLRHEVPPVADSTDFVGVPVERCNLYVPMQSLTAYAADVVWKQFPVMGEGAVEAGAAPTQHVTPAQSDDHGE